MTSVLPSREGVEHSIRQLLRSEGLQQPDEIKPHPDGGIVCLWHEQKLAVIVDLEPVAGIDYEGPP
jgi:hypothetical protein